MFSLHVNVPTCIVLYVSIAVLNCQVSCLQLQIRFCHPTSLIYNFCDCILCDSEDKHVPFQVHKLCTLLLYTCTCMYIHIKDSK